MMMLFYILEEETPVRLVTKQSEAKGAFTALHIRNDQLGQAEDINKLIEFAVAKESKAVVNVNHFSSTLDQTEQRLEAALQRPNNLRSAALKCDRHEEYLIQAGQDILRKIRQERELSQKQNNLADLIFDAAFRRANFIGMPNLDPE